MQAVILAAGRGTRLRPLTYHVPKPMIRIAGKNLIEHNLDILPECISEIILVVGYLGEQIINHFGNEHKGIKIKYIKQNKLYGTGHAVFLCQELLKDRFLVFMGDDIYSNKDIKRCLKHEQCVLAKEVSGKFRGGRIKLNKYGHMEDIIEGIHKKSKGLVNTGLYILNKKIFEYSLVPLKHKKEYGLPQTIIKMAQDYPVNIEKAGFWLQINDLNSLKRIEKILDKERVNL